MEITVQISMLGFCSTLGFMRGFGAIADSLNNYSGDGNSTLRNNSLDCVLGFVVVWVYVAFFLEAVAPIGAAVPVFIAIA